MAVKRYIANKDNTITNAFTTGLSTRGTGSNMGAADILEVFSLYGQGPTTSSVELSRALVQFPIDNISSDRTANTIPASGSVKFYLRMFNARHSEQLPKNYIFNVLAVSSSWEEGQGLDMESYLDTTKDSIMGSNWEDRAKSTKWGRIGGDYHSSSYTATATWTLSGIPADFNNGSKFTLYDIDNNPSVFTYGTSDDAVTSTAIGIASYDGAPDTTAKKQGITWATWKAINSSSFTAINNGDLTLTIVQTGVGPLGNRENTQDAGNVGWTLNDFSGAGMPNYNQTFSEGHEDLEVDVTAAVEEWIAGNQSNYGFGVFLTSSYEAYVTSSDKYVSQNLEGQRTSFYTKRFFSRSSEYFFNRPIIEARWDSRLMDDRGNFYASSSAAPSEDNLNTLFLYNYIRGRLTDIPMSGDIRVDLYASSDGVPTGNSLASTHVIKHKTGIYTASIAVNTTETTLHDVWSGSIGGIYKTGSIKVKNFNDVCVLTTNRYSQFTTKITNLKPSYSKNEQARFRVFTRPRDFSPTIYNVANSNIEGTIIPSASYEIIRMADNYTVINNSTGSSTLHTYLSYDNSGSYFDLDMSLLEPGYMYGVKLAYNVSDGWREQEEVFKFRVEDN